jgi:hypothetical protein
LRSGFAINVRVLAGHNAQQAGFAGTVQAQNADFSAGEKRQIDVLQDGSLGGNYLGDPLHGVNVLGHECS